MGETIGDDDSMDEKKHIIMSSNRATALMTFREIAWIIENAPHLKAGTKAIRYANGGERIELLNGATLDLVSDTRDSSRGRTCDYLWIDELREVSKDGYTAAIPTTRARANSQTLLTSNAGDAFSETLNNLRERALSAPPKSFGFYEYSAPQYCKITDRNGWALANPALGHTITEESLEEAVAEKLDTVTENVDKYLDYVVAEWMSENEIAIESGLRAELTEDFIGGLRNLFAEHYIDVPSEKVDLVSELAEKVEELEGKLNEEIERGISYAKALVESYKNEVTHQVCEGLTDTQAEKIKSLAEGVEFSTEEEYKNKLETIRENYFPSGVKKAAEQDLHEQVEDGSEKKTVTSDAYVQSVIGAISKTKL